MKKYHFLLFLFFGAWILIACTQRTSEKSNISDNKDTVLSPVSDSAGVRPEKLSGAGQEPRATAQETGHAVDKPVVTVYNFHITNRCVSCIAIEEATTKTLNAYFKEEMKSGKVKRQILNVDDKSNKVISEKYQVFGSGLILARSFKGKENTTDLTGDGFRYARNKEEKFIEILKTRIIENLK